MISSQINAGRLIEFDSAAHTYTWVQSGARKRLPSVTQALSIISGYWFVDRKILEAARIFGQHVHLATHYFDRGVLVERTLDPELRFYLDQYKQFLFDTKFQIIESEQIVDHPRLGYAGQLDKGGLWKRSTYLLDLKSGCVPRTVGPQTAAYQAARGENGDRPRRRLCLQLARDRYKIIACEDRSDFDQFMSALNNYRFIHRSRNPYAEQSIEGEQIAAAHPDPEIQRERAAAAWAAGS